MSRILYQKDVQAVSHFIKCLLRFKSLMQRELVGL